MWSPKRELVKRAAVIASDNHPNGFNKQQLIEASEEVFGGFSANPLKQIKTHEDINNMGNHMALVDGGYPVGMSGCFVVGINGGCGIECPVYLDGDCGEPEEMIPQLSDEDLARHHELYGE